MSARPNPAALALSQFAAESWADFLRDDKRYAVTRGDARSKPVAYTRAMLDEARYRCLSLAEGGADYDGNCFAVGASRNRRNYVVGAAGFKVGVGAAPGHTPLDADLATLAEFVAAFADLNDLGALTRQALYRLDFQGNALLRLFPAGGVPEVRFIEPDRLRCPEYAAGARAGTCADIARQWGIDTAPDDARRVLGYWVERFPGDPDPEYVDAGEVVHVRDDDDGAGVMGWPAFEPAVAPLLDAERLLYAGATRCRVQAKYAFFEKVPGLNQSAADDYKARLVSLYQPDPAGGQPALVQVDPNERGYGLVKKTPNDITPANMGGGAADVELLKLARLTEAATALNVPRWMFSGEPDEKYANAFAALGPALQSFLALQHLLAGSLVTNVMGRRASLVWRAVRLGVESGMLPPAVLRSCRPTCTPPTLESRDRAGDVAADKTLVDGGAMSVRTWQERSGLDPAKEVQRGAKAADGGARAGTPPEPGNPAGPGVSATGAAAECLTWAADARGWWADVEVPARAASPAAVERWAAEGRDLSKLVKTVITDKNGVRRTVYKRPKKGETAGAGKSGDGPGPAKPPARADDEQSVRDLLGDPAKLTPEAVGKLADALSRLTVKQIQAIKSEHKVKGGKLKAELIGRVVEFAKSRATTADPTPPGPEPEPPVPEVSAVDYKQTNPDHPVAKAIRGDAASAKVVATLLAEFEADGRVATNDRKRVFDEKEAAWDAYSAALSAGKPRSVRDPLEKDWRAKSKAHEKFDARVVADQKAARRRLADLIAPERPLKVVAKADPGDPALAARSDILGQPFVPTPAEKKSLDTAVSFVSAVTEGAGLPGGVRASVVRSPFGRAYFQDRGGGVRPDEIAVGVNMEDSDFARSHGFATVTSTAVHEFGHLIETRKPGVQKMVNDFLAYRVGDEPLTDLGTVTGGERMAGEVGRKDNFDRHLKGTSAYYCGKQYKDSAGNVQASTEIVSMGLESIFRDPVGFARDDPEYFQFVVSVLRKK